MKNNTLAFIALSNEYCSAIENCEQAESRRDFVGKMLSLLPRIYICTRDLESEDLAEEGYIDSILDENDYDSARRNIENLLGDQDTYLETFEDDMKYSDTPIGASVAEGLCDLFQVLYNFVETVRDAPEELILSAVAAVKEDFEYTWSKTLCNVLRPLNNIYYNDLV